MLNPDQQIRFTRLWTEAHPTVRQYVASLVREQSAAQDVLQNTSLALLRKFVEYDESRSFVGWALGVAKYEVLGHRRDVARNRMICDSEFLDLYTQHWADAAPRINDEELSLRHCVGELSGRAKSIVELRYAKGKTSDAIADKLNLTAANVRTTLKRTREALRRCVERQMSLRGDSA